jgi:hypothetical protein
MSRASGERKTGLCCVPKVCIRMNAKSIVHMKGAIDVA